MRTGISRTEVLNFPGIPWRSWITPGLGERKKANEDEDPRRVLRGNED
jgi:hypothetical protein